MTQYVYNLCAVVGYSCGHLPGGYRCGESVHEGTRVEQTKTLLEMPQVYYVVLHMEAALGV